MLTFQETYVFLCVLLNRSSCLSCQVLPLVLDRLLRVVLVPGVRRQRQQLRLRGQVQEEVRRRAHLTDFARINRQQRSLSHLSTTSHFF